MIIRRQKQLPPLVIGSISLIYILGSLAGAVELFTDSATWIDASLTAVLFALGIGLWRLRLWARIAEIAFAVTQIAAAMYLLSSSWSNIDSTFVFAVTIVALVNVFVLYYLSTPQVRMLFRRNSSAS